MNVEKYHVPDVHPWNRAPISADLTFPVMPDSGSNPLHLHSSYLEKFHASVRTFESEFFRLIDRLSLLLESEENNTVDFSYLRTIQESLLNFNHGVFTSFISELNQLYDETKNAYTQLEQRTQHCKELEALLAERESQLVSQSNELHDVESRLDLSSQQIVALHRRVSTNHEKVLLLLEQLSHEQPGSLCEIFARIAAAQESGYPLSTGGWNDSKDSLTQLNTTEINRTDIPSSDTKQLNSESQAQTMVFVSRETQTDLDGIECTPGQRSLKKHIPENFTFARPSDVLTQLSSDALLHPTSEQVSMLYQALRNASTQIDRLNKYRLSQKHKMEQLQQRFVQMNNELDATVDALRYHQSSSENERRRSAADVAELRAQLAKANALLLQQKKYAEANEFNYKSRYLGAESRVLPTAPSQTTQDQLVSNLNCVNVELETTKTEVIHLRTDLAQQKVSSDRETTKLRGQLTEALADCRMLKLQLNRLQNSNGSGGKGEPLPADISCSNCSRLQRLVDIIQSKKEREWNGTQNQFIVTSAVQCNLCPCHAVCDTSSESHQLKHAVDGKMLELSVVTNHPDANSTNSCRDALFSDYEKSVSIPNSHVVLKDPGVDSGLFPEEVLTPPSPQLFHISPSVCSSTTETPSQYIDTMKIKEQAVQTYYSDLIPAPIPPRPFDLLGESCGAWSVQNDSPDVVQTYTQARAPFDSWQDLIDELLFLRSKLQQYQSASEVQPSPAQQSPLVQEVSEDTPSREQLLQRLNAAEREAEEAVAQLKASNAEFLTLRERVSHAASERAYLKSCVEGLDEQVSQLEQTLYERTQLLNQCQNELSMRAQAHVIPIPRSWSSMHTVHMPSVKRLCSVLQRYCRLGLSCHPSNQISELPLIVDASGSRTHHRMISINHVIGHVKSFFRARIIPCLLSAAPRLRLPLSQPRPIVVLGFLAYLFLVHVLLIRFLFL